MMEIYTHIYSMRMLYNMVRLHTTHTSVGKFMPIRSGRKIIDKGLVFMVGICVTRNV